MEIDAWTVYWVMQATEIKSFLMGAGTLFAIIMWIVCPIMLMIGGTEGDAEIIKWGKRLLKASVIPALMVAVGVFTPNTQTLAAMYVIPAIANSDAVEVMTDDAAELYQLGVDRIRDELTKKGTE